MVLVQRKSFRQENSMRKEQKRKKKTNGSSYIKNIGITAKTLQSQKHYIVISKFQSNKSTITIITTNDKSQQQQQHSNNNKED